MTDRFVLIFALLLLAAVIIATQCKNTTEPLTPERLRNWGVVFRGDEDFALAVEAGHEMERRKLAVRSALALPYPIEKD